MTKVVINNCFGGFSLSDTAWALLAERKGGVLHTRESKLGGTTCHIVMPDGAEIYNMFIERDDADLVAIVEVLGTNAASGDGSQLEIVTLPDDVTQWFISDYDGEETLREGYVGRAFDSKEVTL